MIIALFSCEKVIDFDLEDAEQKIVIEAIIHDSLGDNFVILSKSRPFNDNSPIEMISDANVQVLDDQNNSHTLYEVLPGYYTDSTLQGVAYRTYHLAVTINGTTYSGSSYMYPRVEIDSLHQEQIEKLFWKDKNIPEYQVFCHFTDPVNVENFYRIKAYVDGKQESGVLTFPDEFFDGLSTYFPIFESEFFEGDSVYVELLSIDEINHRYFNAIYNAQEGQVPGNPTSNINHKDVVGYFGAYAKSEKSMIIVPE